MASLVLHYLKDWAPALSELRRVLKPGGRMIASVEHPFAMNLMHRQAGREAEYNYFDTTNWTDEWTMGGRSALMSRWHRPLHAMTDAFTAAGFRITVISEPPPTPPPVNCSLRPSRPRHGSCASCSSSWKPTGPSPAADGHHARVTSMPPSARASRTTVNRS